VPAPPLGRRERKKLETRDRILECAAKLIASRGYDATTMDDIGECADVSRATVFNYFPRKEDIVLEWFSRLRADVAEIITGAEDEAGDTAERLRRGLRGLALRYENDAAAGRAMVRAWLRAGGPLMPNVSDSPALFAAAIRSGQGRGDVSPDVDADRAGLVIFDAYMGALYRWVRDEDGRFDFEKDLIAMLDLLLVGIARPPADERNRKRRAKTSA
jgi:AcrR family transcriptional regulator